MPYFIPKNHVLNFPLQYYLYPRGKLPYSMPYKTVELTIIIIDILYCPYYDWTLDIRSKRASPSCFKFLGGFHAFSQTQPSGPGQSSSRNVRPYVVCMLNVEC